MALCPYTGLHNYDHMMICVLHESRCAPTQAKKDEQHREDTIRKDQQYQNMLTKKDEILFDLGLYTKVIEVLSEVIRDKGSMLHFEKLGEKIFKWAIYLLEHHGKPIKYKGEEVLLTATK